MTGTGQQAATAGAQAGGAIATTMVSTAWIPVVGAAVAGVTLALALIFNRKGPKQKRATTAIVNDLEPLLKQNLDAYLSGPRTSADQAAALKNFDDAWEWLASSQALGNPEMGNPGQWAIGDRNRGGKWDWFAYYRDPIANDSPAASSVDQAFASITGGNNQMLLAIALLALGVLL